MLFRSLTNLEVTNIKAKDGTASASIADSTGAFTVSAAFAANGGVTLGDASGDALTINSSAVSIPNGLNFDSNTLVIDATNNYVGVGTSSPSYPFVVSHGGAKGIEFIPNSDTTVSEMLAYNRSGAAYSTMRYRAADHQFYISGAEKMRIDSSGNVGIGTSSQIGRAHV